MVKIEFQRDLFKSAFQLLFFIFFNEIHIQFYLEWIGGCMLVAQSQLKMYGLLNNQGQINKEEGFRAYILNEELLYME